MSSTVRSKFTVNSITQHLGSKRDPADASGKNYVQCLISTVKLSPVYAGNDPTHENAKFWESTPSGEISLTCVNAEAVEKFVIGKQCYVDFTFPE